jgi:hypothetical protein
VFSLVLRCQGPRAAGIRYLRRRGGTLFTRRPITRKTRVERPFVFTLNANASETARIQ